jgi:hypothetical protein
VNTASNVRYGFLSDIALLERRSRVASVLNEERQQVTAGEKLTSPKIVRGKIEKKPQRLKLANASPVLS